MGFRCCAVYRINTQILTIILEDNHLIIAIRNIFYIPTETLICGPNYHKKMKLIVVILPLTLQFGG